MKSDSSPVIDLESPQPASLARDVYQVIEWRNPREEKRWKLIREYCGCFVREYNGKVDAGEQLGPKLDPSDFEAKLVTAYQALIDQNG